MELLFNMCILVTGLKGFTGRYVQLELEAHGHIVVGLNSDLTNADAVSKEILQLQPKSVLHLAGISFVNHVNSNDFYDVNLIGTFNLLTAIAKYAPNVESILLASSANIYGNSTEELLSECTIPSPDNDYAVSKISMEYMARLWFKRLPVFIVRPFNYTGIGQNGKFLIPKIVSHFKNKKQVIELGNLDVWREFGDVRSVANIYRKLIECCPAGKTINICTSQTYSIREVINLCGKITGRDIEIEVNTDFIRKNELKVLTGDNSLLKKTIGNWKNYTLKDTLRWMLQK
jgi:nucleoside-diphosphate-sugar epimerase